MSSTAPFVHDAVRWLTDTVALGAGEDPEDLGVTRARRFAARSTVPYPGLPAQALGAAHAQAAEEILFERVPARLRSTPRS
jgi:hypothetical protein